METNSCNFCKKTAEKLLACGACYRAKYCHIECQKKDWKQHKLSCKESLNTTIKQPSSETQSIAKDTSDNYNIIKKIGSGNFSEIYEVVNKTTGQIFAMKTIEKAKLKRLNKEKDVIMEKYCLKKLEGSNYVVKLFETFQDEFNLYIIMELVHGGELWEIVRSFGLDGLSIIKYYIAHIINALEYSHGKGIIHRDLKVFFIMNLNKFSLISQKTLCLIMIK